MKKHEASVRFVAGGPAVPVRLLELLERDEVVFFCGSRVAEAAGYCGLKELVGRVCAGIPADLTAAERADVEQGHEERALWSLENRYGGLVREQVKRVLGGAGAQGGTHEALVRLANTRPGTLRLVTTNLDRGFVANLPPACEFDAAPRLPTPAREGWRTLVHLHGMVGDGRRDGMMVLTSADYRRAYISERWATRFLTAVVRNFAVVLVGYELDDPFLRYSMEAVAAPRGDGEGRLFLFTSAEAGPAETTEIWASRGMTAIEYGTDAKLWETLEVWSRRQEDFRRGGGGVVEEMAGLGRRPSGEESDASQMGWVLGQPDGQAAARFAHLAPTPALEWLEVLTGEGLLPGEPPLVAKTNAAQQERLSRPVAELAQWLLEHLEGERLVEWVLEQGGCVHGEFRDLINYRLSERPLEEEGLQRLWQVLASDWYGMALSQQPSYTNVSGRLRSEPWSAVLCRDVLHHITPHLVVAPVERRELRATRKGLARYADAALAVPAGFDMDSLESALERHGRSTEILAELAEPLTGALEQALGLLRVVGQVDGRHDWTIFARPSVPDHEKNLTERDWSQLIGLAYRAWRGLWAKEPARARTLVKRWQTLEYPVFRRLAYTAMAETPVVGAQEALEYVLEEGGWWLWSRQVRRELLLVLRAIGSQLSAAKLARLVRGVLNGPPRAVLPEGLSEEEFAEAAGDMVWLRLKKLEEGGLALPAAAAERLKRLEEESGRRRLSGDGSEEVQTGVVLGGQAAGAGLILSCFEESTPETESGWRQILEMDVALAGDLLGRAAAEGRYPVERWQEFLGCEGLVLVRDRVWREWLPALGPAPVEVWRALAVDLARWLQQEMGGGLPEEEVWFWALWDRIAEQALEVEFAGGEEAVERAERHPAGLLAATLLEYLAHLNPRSGGEVPPPAWQRLNALLGAGRPGTAAATLTLCRSLDWLYTLVPEWTGINLLPLLDWSANPRAGACWQAFCYHLCFSAELWPVLKEEFLTALRHTKELGKPVEAAYGWLAFILVDRPEWLTEEESRRALLLLPAEGRTRVASGLLVRLEGAEEKEEFWRARLEPVFARRWPKELRLRDAESSYNLATVCIESGGAFGEALGVLGPLLVPIQYRSRFLAEFTQLGRGLLRAAPAESLELLYRTIAEARRDEPRLLREALMQIAAARPELEKDARHRALLKMIG